MLISRSVSAPRNHKLVSRKIPSIKSEKLKKFQRSVDIKIHFYYFPYKQDSTCLMCKLCDRNYIINDERKLFSFHDNIVNSEVTF